MTGVANSTQMARMVRGWARIDFDDDWVWCDIRVLEFAFSHAMVVAHGTPHVLGGAADGIDRGRLAP
jgi:hypothetical protein